MSGASATAISAARQTVAGLDHKLALETPWLEAVTPIVYQTLVTFGKWDAVLDEPLPAGSRGTRPDSPTTPAASRSRPGTASPKRARRSTR
jgi:hypothetical protein